MGKQTVSWLDFLFDSTGELLAKHISDPQAEPSPAQLIVQFLERSGALANNVNQQESSTSQPLENKRAKRLHQLALHVAYLLKWNLDVLEESLPLQWQNVLFSELQKTAPAAEKVNQADVELDKLDSSSIMIMILYHRWVVRTVAQHFIPSFGKPANNSNGLLDGAVTENILKNLREKLPVSLKVLEQAVEMSKDLCLPKVLITDTTVKKTSSVSEPPNEIEESQKEDEKMEVDGENVDQETKMDKSASSCKEGETHVETESAKDENKQVSCEKMCDEVKMSECQEGEGESPVIVSRDEVHAQVSFDIATLYFYQEKFEQAVKLFEGCRKTECSRTSFYTVERDTLDGYYSACCGLLGRPSDPTLLSDPQLGPLDMKIEKCRDTGYKGIISLLIEDNISMCLPREYRSSLQEELKERAGTNNEDLGMEDGLSLAWQAEACNAVRDVLEIKPVQPGFWWSLKKWNPKELECLFNICVKSVPIEGDSVAKDLEKNPRFKALKSFLELVCHSVEEIDGWNILFQSNTRIFVNEEDEQMYNSNKASAAKPDNVELKNVELFHLKGELERDTKLKSGYLQHQLFKTFDPEEVDQVVHQLHGLDPGKKHAERFMCMLYKSYLDEIRDLMLQDVLHVLLSKAFYCSKLKDYSMASKLLAYAAGVVDEHTRQSGNTPYLHRTTTALHQELMVLRIMQDSQQSDKRSELANTIKSYVWQTKQGAITHAHIEMKILLFLLNGKEWDLVSEIKPDENVQNINYRKLSNLLANTCSSLSKPQVWRKMARNFWDGVLRIFSGTGQQKRQSDGITKRDSTSLSMVEFTNFVLQLTEETALSVAISCLVKLHNSRKQVEVSEVRKEIWSSYLHLWPTSVTNASQINFDHVNDVMSQLVKHAVQEQPNNAQWLHTLADIYLGSSNYSAALKCYLEAGAASSVFFSLPVPSSVWDEQVYKNMVTCCSALKAHVQAAILCQCIDPVDYSTAFRALQLAATSSDDAMDYYYNFFWDVTVLEYLVNIHTKRGQHEKKKLTIQIMSQPELNTFNSTDVLQHTEQTRRNKFFRSLAKQFL